jgi:hypothetical protein
MDRDRSRWRTRRGVSVTSIRVALVNLRYPATRDQSVALAVATGLLARRLKS